MSLSGVWTNEYGSRMSLWVGADGTVQGRYASTTGSTGEYRVSGHAGPGDAGPKAGQPVALAISWHSIVAGEADPSWDWCSALSGQVSLRPDGPELVLTHALVASSAFPGLAEAGTHIDRLTYRRIGDAGPVPAGMEGPFGDIASPLTGVWQDGEGGAVALRLTGDQGFDRVAGTLRRAGLERPLSGFAGRGAARSLSVTARLADGSVTALAGTLPRGGAVLSLIELTSHATAPDSTYLQTLIHGRRFVLG